MSPTTRPPTETQLSPLHGPHVLITAHNADGKAVIKEMEPVQWVSYAADRLSMAVLWTTQFPPDLTADADVALHRARMAAPGGPGLALGGGTVLRYVDFAPAYECFMHRTQSVDYGIVVQGDVLAKFDSGEERLLHAGDVCIQRATMHRWTNNSKTEWARMIFCLQDAKPLYVNNERYKEDGVGDILPPSANDK